MNSPGINLRDLTIKN